MSKVKIKFYKRNAVLAHSNQFYVHNTYILNLIKLEALTQKYSFRIFWLQFLVFKTKS